MEIIETVRGKPSLLYNGFSYRKYRQNKHGEVTWLCLKEKSANCKGRLVTKDNEEVRVVDHDCVPDEAGIVVKKIVFVAKKRVREDSDTPVRKVFKQEIESLQNKGYAFLTHLPQFSNLKSSLYLHRIKSERLKIKYKQSEEVVLDDGTLNMADGSTFLMANEEEQDTI